MARRAITGPAQEPRENPLVPFATMRRIYVGMVESRLLEARLARGRGEGKRSPFEGQEACRSAVLAALEPDDLSCDVPGAASSEWLRGSSLDDVLRGGPSLGGDGIRLPVAGRCCVLPALSDRRQRFGVSLGAAMAVKQAKLPRTLVGFLDVKDAKALFSESLRCAVLYELPMLFVVLPEQGTRLEEAGAFSISAKATRLGVPGIPVDANDPVALFRVAQESLLRARAGGGAALMECVPLSARLDGKAGAKSRLVDPITAFRKTLLRSGACDKAWLAAVEPTFHQSLGRIKGKRAR